MYTGKTNLEAALGRYADNFLADDTVTNALITEQSALIDDYLRANPALDFTTIPPIITSICTKRCVYELYLRISAGDMPDHVMADFKNTEKLLDKIVSGQIKIGVQAVSSMKFSASERVFDRCL